MIRTFTMRLKTTKRQGETLNAVLAQLCELYNMALQQRRDVWKSHRLRIGYYDQQKQLTELRGGVEEYRNLPVKIQRDPLRRLDQAFQAFFRRCASGNKPGFPRFRSRERYDSFGLEPQGFRFEEGNLVIRKVGTFKTKTRFRVQGKPLELRIKRCGMKWRAQLVCDVGPAPDKVAVQDAVGIDLGLNSLAVLSDGTEIPNPRWTKQEENRLAVANRSLASKRRGSKNRGKARERVRRVHQRIAGLRSAYLVQVAKHLVSSYDLIAHEELKIPRMVKSKMAKSILDAAWRQLIGRLQCEAEKAGKWDSSCRSAQYH